MILQFSRFSNPFRRGDTFIYLYLQKKKRKEKNTSQRDNTIKGKSFYIPLNFNQFSSSDRCVNPRVLIIHGLTLPLSPVVKL